MRMLLGSLRSFAAAARRRRAVRVLGVLVAACLGAAVARADEDPSGRVGRVAEVSGDVRTVTPDGAWVALPRNQPMSTGDRVVTGAEGHATVEIGSSTVRVGPNSDMALLRLDDQKIFLRFEHGQMAVRVRSADILGELTITTDEGVWVPHHPGYDRFDRAPNGVLAAQAWTGDMLLEAPDSSLPLAAGQRAEVWREGAQQTTHYRLVPAPTDAFSDWAMAQDRLDERAAAANASGAAAVPAEMTGGADLSRYGQWSRSPELGEVWTPKSLPAGWAPYQAGAWAWISPWGWTWIDDTPWGFAPFHYGRWTQSHGRWCWTPGRWTGRAVYAPALVGWIAGPGLVVGGAPAVGWVPLAPGEPVFPGYAVSPRYWSAVNDGRPAPRDRGAEARGRPRFVPVGPAADANRRVPGAAMVVATSALVPGVPVSTMPALAKADRKRWFDGGGAALVQMPPPGPPGGHAALPAGSVVQVPASALPPLPAVPVSAGQGAAAPNPAASMPAPAPATLAKPAVARPTPPTAPAKPDAHARTAREPSLAASPAAVARPSTIVAPVVAPMSVAPTAFAPVAPRPVGTLPVPAVASVAPVMPVVPIVPVVPARSGAN